ncbi:MAG TPA: tripartite tricarboxylate transporter substrate binding protein [Xanthobacteraceae bacterium]|nr:tripartite tricarboxylate transporter substrate binding protein [Xanthobacteraceae bacterium]
MLHRAVLSAALAVAITSSIVKAQDYPARPVRIIVGFGAGAVADTPARLLAQKFSQSLGQQFVVENKPGAGSSIAAEYVSRASPDGHTLFMATSANTINVTTASLGFDITKDFAPIALICAVPNMLVVHPSLGVSNLKQLIALAKQKPDQIHFGSSGTATTTHLAGELINQMAGVKLVHVPYPGSAQALADVLTGRIPLLFAPASAVIQHVEKGQLKAIAVTQLTRAGIAPDVPTMAEAGLPGYDIGLWFGLLAPAGTPRDIVDKLARVANEALQADDVTKALRAQGLDPLGMGPDDFARYIVSEVKKGAAVAQAAGLKK